MFRLRLVPEKTNIKFMKGRFAGLAVSAFLSIASIILFFYPGLNYGIDFKGGILMEVRLTQAADFGALRSQIGALGLGEVALQEFGSQRDVLIRLERQGNSDEAQNDAAQQVRVALTSSYPGTEVRRVEVVGGKISAELFQSGLLAVGLALAGIAIYIWFRFEWMFALAALITLLLDITKGRQADVFDRSIDITISRLRQKIEEDPKNPQFIKTVRGKGYIFSAEIG
ncbi:MAG: winged helix-turn-helix domain-containing protein [Ferrovibrio sp.]